MIEVIFYKYDCGCIGTPLGNGQALMISTCGDELAIREMPPITDELEEVTIEEIKEILKDINVKINICDQWKDIFRTMLGRKE